MYRFYTAPSIGTADGSIFKMSIFLLLIFFIQGIAASPQAEETGEQAELIRLRDAADEAMSMGDPHGAALNSGKAALMAAFLAKHETQRGSRTNFHSLEALLRAQEHVYRAIALFQQSGSHIPASSGVCQTISLASTQREKAKIFSSNPPTENPLFQNLSSEVQEWEETIGELLDEFGCMHGQDH